MLRWNWGVALSIGAALGLGLSGSIASAADMPVKAPPLPATPFVLDVHGYVDVTFANTRVTGGGLLLYPTGSLLTQVTTGISLDLYKNSSGFINSVSVYGGVWNEVWSDAPAGVRHWQEMDWWAGVSIGFAQNWKLSAEHLEFAFPWGLPTAVNWVFTLAYNDGHLGWPITINPSLTLFYNERGGSTVVFGKRTDTYRIVAGINPTLNLQRSHGIPLTLSAPTSVAFGPDDFWNRNDGTTNFCGPATNAPCSLSNLGYVSTGIQAKYLLDTVVPKRLGTWYVKGGAQYFHIINDALLAAQTPAGTNVVANFPSAKEDVVVVNGGFGFSF
jgi:hypothetical protein